MKMVLVLVEKIVNKGGNLKKEVDTFFMFSFVGTISRTGTLALQGRSVSKGNVVRRTKVCNDNTVLKHFPF